MATYEELLRQQQGGVASMMPQGGLQPPPNMELNMPPQAASPPSAPGEEEITPMQIAIAQAIQNLGGGLGAGLASRLSGGAVDSYDYRRAVGNNQNNVLNLLMQKANARKEEETYQRRRTEGIEDTRKQKLFEESLLNKRPKGIDPYSEEAIKGKIRVADSKRKPEKATKKTDYELYKEDPEAYGKYKAAGRSPKKKSGFSEARKMVKDFSNLTQEEKVRQIGMFENQITDVGYRLVPRQATIPGKIWDSSETRWSVFPTDKVVSGETNGRKVYTADGKTWYYLDTGEPFKGKFVNQGVQ